MFTVDKKKPGKLFTGPCVTNRVLHSTYVSCKWYVYILLEQILLLLAYGLYRGRKDFTICEKYF